MRWIYGALYRDAAATLDDLSEAVTTLEDTGTGPRVACWAAGTPFTGDEEILQGKGRRSARDGELHRRGGLRPRWRRRGRFEEDEQLTARLWRIRLVGNGRLGAAAAN